MTKTTIQVVRSCDLTPTRQLEFFALALHACRADRQSLGWLPTPAYIYRHERGEIHVVSNNDDIVGYALWSLRGQDLRIFHTWIRSDARMLLHGRALVDELTRVGRATGATRITLWCAIDLPANQFWRALRFNPGVWRWGKGHARRKHRAWTKRINPRTETHQQPSPSRGDELDRSTETHLLPFSKLEGRKA